VRLARNPLVARFLATGLRRGKHSFHLPLLGFVLATLVVVNCALYWAGESLPPQQRIYADFAAFSLSLYLQLLGFNSLLLAGGAIRAYVALAREKRDETLQFLTGSALGAREIAAGLFFGAQLPAYLSLVVSLPLCLICVLGGVSWTLFIWSHILLLSTATLLTLFALLSAARERKPQSGALLILLPVLILLVVRVDGLSDWPLAYQLSRVFNPIILLLNVSGLRTEEHLEELLVFGLLVPTLPVALAAYLGVAIFLGAALVRSIEPGAGPRSRPWWSALCYAFLLLLLHAFDPAGMPSTVPSRAAYNTASLLLFGVFLLGRSVSGEEYLLSRSFDDPRSPARHPLRLLLPDTVLFGAIHLAGFSLHLVRAGEALSPASLLPALAGLAPLGGMLLVDLGMGLSPCTDLPRRGMLFRLAVALPPVAALPLGGLFSSQLLGWMVASLSPPALGLILALPEEYSAARHPACLAVASGSGILLLGLGALLLRGQHRRLEKLVLMMQSAAESPTPPRA
jgi:hypothetical protein